MSAERKELQQFAKSGSTPQPGAPSVASTSQDFLTAAPSLSLPKGGGAIRGIGEKFATNPVTGTGSMTVPIATSPGRSGFGPELSLTYDSGAGNGPFGLGWSLSLSSITRKTDKGLPTYSEGRDGDTFVLSGAEDLVPSLVPVGGGWQRPPAAPPRILQGSSYRVETYRPRTEGGFSRIERWTNEGDKHDVFWRTISRDNVTSWYGRSDESRIADPEESWKIFSWLLCEKYDDKGNLVLYRYKQEDATGIGSASAAHERNRSEKTRATNRYLQRILYGNRTPYFPELNAATPAAIPSDWCFEVIFDYGEYDAAVPLPSVITRPQRRPDPFSTYRAGFEVRTYQLCRRVLMFHHFPGEVAVSADCLVRSTDFEYSVGGATRDPNLPIYSVLESVVQRGYRRDGAGYLARSLPPLELRYSQPVIQDAVHEVAASSLDALAHGIDGGRYQWVDLDGDGCSGVLTEQAGAWFYKRNLSPVTPRASGTGGVEARLGAVEHVARLSSLAALSGGRQQLLDLGGDGQIDLVDFDGPVPGFHERDSEQGWRPFQPFSALPQLDWRNSELKFVDLTGDGNADLFLTEDDAFCWYASLAKEGFGPARRVTRALDEEEGPTLLFSDRTQAIFLADFSGDGLADLVRVRNGDVCYWPNLGYGRFGAKVTMDGAPRFEPLDLFDPKRLRLADLDGSGPTDLVYLGSEGVDLYINQSGNRWSTKRRLGAFPQVDSSSSVLVMDLLGNGTACLVWSSPLPVQSGRQLRYLELMGGQKPHLLVQAINNLGAETRIEYAPSTKFYLTDKLEGKPWVTRLPFPVQVVERVETFDAISQNRFVTCYSYHHGYFDGVEREFRGFGRVDQLDTEEFAALSVDGKLPASNEAQASHVPPVLTRSWFHTGAFLDLKRISRQFEHEYYREGADAGLLDMPAGERPNATSPEPLPLLDDTVLPNAARHDDGLLPVELTSEEVLEAARSLKGALLRQEVYARDASSRDPLSPVHRPFSASQRNYTIEILQPRGENPHAVYFAHAREQLDFHYERSLVDVDDGKLGDPRVAHTLTLNVDERGNVLASVSVGYRRRDLPDVHAEQTQTHLTLTVNRYANRASETDWYRVGLPVESRTYEIVKPPEPTLVARRVQPYPFGVIAALVDKLLPNREIDPPDEARWPYKDWDWRRDPSQAPAQSRLRTIDHVRTLYRADDLSGPLDLGAIESLVLPFESYKLAFTAELVESLYVDSGKLAAAETDGALGDEGKYCHSEGDPSWWLRSGQVFYSPSASETTDEEKDFARAHFFQVHRYRSPFHKAELESETLLVFDNDALFPVESRDAVKNVTRAEIDYRVLAPRALIDPNDNRTEVCFDALGLVVASAVMGKPGEDSGDRLEGFDADPPLTDLQSFIADPRAQAASLLGQATTRVVYDVGRYHRTSKAGSGQAPFAASASRETHVAELAGAEPRIQLSFSYSDGFGREVQQKIQAEPGDAWARLPNVVADNGEVEPGALQRDAAGGLVNAPAESRWVGTGRTVFNNKGKPVRQYEPFFSATHLREDDAEVTETGVSPILFYDPLGRVVGTLHPDHTWEKVVFDPWRQETWDASDTLELADPRLDQHLGAFFERLPAADFTPTWLALREAGSLGADEMTRARQAKVHAATPAVAHADSLGRTFLSLVHNRFKYSDASEGDAAQEEFYSTRVTFDVEGNQREVAEHARIAAEEESTPRIVMRYEYDLLGNRTCQASMEAGRRWTLNDVAGKPLYGWDDRQHRFRTGYDALRRPVESFLQQGTAAELLVGRNVYDTAAPGEEGLNLRGQLYQSFDQAGVVTNHRYDFKGNLLQNSRQLAQRYASILDWSAPITLESETFTSQRRYDALNRPIQIIAPHSDRAGATLNILQPSYNDANLLEAMDAWLDQTVEPPGLLPAASASLHAVTGIEYDAKGQRRRIDYGNTVSTEYEYDPLTFRLVHLVTRRSAEAFPDDCPKPAPPAWPGCQVQNLRYTYDPLGNVTSIRDSAQQAIYFGQQRVDPSAEYTYDATSRLIEATGREHLGQIGGTPIPHSYGDAGRTRLPHPNDGQALSRYLERYAYDAVGNILSLQHRGLGPGSPKWTRRYEYDEASLLQAERKSNRLSATVVGNGTTATETYSTAGDGYDPHGNMLQMPQLQVMRWDFKDQLQMTQRQAVNADDADGAARQGERTWYVYDSSGERVRKVTERATVGAAPAARKNERIYLGGFEVYRQYETDGTTLKLERETLHVMDDQRRVALVETRTRGSEPDVARQLVRYQFGNHLGSASLELDDRARIISYEEYTPYGSASYLGVDPGLKAAAKRYRYTGKERDEETGLGYHGARYYSPWLGRWMSADPSGPGSGTNLYAFVGGRPSVKVDSNGLWETDMHFLSVYWSGRMQGASHAQSMNAAIASQSLDDSAYTSAPDLKFSLNRENLRLANNSHALAIDKASSERVAREGVKEHNVFLFGLGLHTVGDYLPHANTTGKPTAGHQVGLNESLSESWWLAHQADHTSENPRKALATFESFRRLWSIFLPGSEYEQLKASDSRLDDVAAFIFKHPDDFAGKEQAAIAGLKNLGVTDRELSDVLTLYRSRDLRFAAMESIAAGIKGGRAIARAQEVWLERENDALFSAGVQDITQDIEAVPQITSNDFESRRSANVARTLILREMSRYESHHIYP